MTLLNGDLLAARGERMLQVNAVCRIRCGRLPFESHHGVAQRRNRTLSDAPLFAIALVYRAVGLAPLQNHPHTWHTGEPPHEVLVEILVGEEGVLESVKRMGDRLSLTMKYKGRERFGSLQWDAPPSLDAVERVLLGNLGKPIKTVGDLDA
jgi:hypothetical protein